VARSDVWTKITLIFFSGMTGSIDVPILEGGKFGFLQVSTSFIQANPLPADSRLGRQKETRRSLTPENREDPLPTAL